MKEFLVRTSERSKFKKCRQSWQWSYVDLLSPRRVSSALEFGTLAHRVLELRYPPGRKRGRKPDAIAKDVWTEYLRADGEEFTVKSGEENVPAGDLLVHMMENYYNEYGDDDRYKVLSSEMTFQVKVNDPDTSKYLFTYVGTIDGVWEDVEDQTVVFAEHKTGASLDPFGAPIYLDEQQASYWAFGPIWLEHQGIVKPGQPIDYVLYNRLRKGFRDPRPCNDDGHRLNKDGSVSKRQPIPLFKREKIMRTQSERALTMGRIRDEVREMKLVRKGKLSVYKTPDRHCGFCEFRDMCEVHESGSDWESMKEGMFNTWDPYEDHSNGGVE